MPRRKSLNDLDRQRNRLRNEALRQGNGARASRIENTYMRYMDNVRRTRGYQSSARRFANDMNASFAATDPNVSRAYEDRAMRQFDRTFDRQYSQRTYMGLNNG